MCCTSAPPPATSVNMMRMAVPRLLSGVGVAAASFGVAASCEANAPECRVTRQRALCKADVKFPEPKDERVVKRVVFVRHGQGVHNLGRPQEFDPELTSQGVNEARAVFAGELACFRPTIVLVSPLWRTLQTCTEALRARGDVRCPVHAIEDVREHNNLNACNHRRTLSGEHYAAFPEVQFSAVDAIGPECGADWDHQSYKSSVLRVRARAAHVLNTLAALPDARIIVFTHGTFIRCVQSEVLQLSPHAWGACPPTGTPVEVQLIETHDGRRYWELPRPATLESIAAGAPTTRKDVT